MALDSGIRQNDGRGGRTYDQGRHSEVMPVAGDVSGAKGIEGGVTFPLDVNRLQGRPPVIVGLAVPQG
jgi:hypothetical protein